MTRRCTTAACRRRHSRYGREAQPTGKYARTRGRRGSFYLEWRRAQLASRAYVVATAIFLDEL